MCASTHLFHKFADLSQVQFHKSLYGVKMETRLVFQKSLYGVKMETGLLQKRLYGVKMETRLVFVHM